MTAAPLSQSIARSLAEDIISGQLSPGRKLDEQSLAQRFEVSRTPIRDALRELAATRLIEYVPRSGFSVAHVDAEKLDDMFEAASEIEALCARLCALRATTTDRTRIDHIHRRGEAAAAKKNAKEYAALNEELHAAIYAGSRNKTIETFALDIRRRLSPFRSRMFYSPGRIQSSVSEHEDIVSAILTHDDDKAAIAMRNHIAHAALNVIKYFQGQSR
jgi:DNA-binding GntR family transcriptional regulator